MDKQITSRFLLHQLLMVAALALPSTSFAQGLFAQAANSATQVRDAYAEIYNGFYGVGKQKTLLRAALDRRPDGTPNISVDAEEHTADVTIRLFVNDSAYDAWKANAHQRLDTLVKSVDDFDSPSSHDRVIGGKVYRFGDNEFSAIQKWEQSGTAKEAEIVVRVLFHDKSGTVLWHSDIPLENFRRSGGKESHLLYNLNRLGDLTLNRNRMNRGDKFWEGIWEEINGSELGSQEIEDAAAVIRINKMSDDFMKSVEDVECIVIDDETLVADRLATREMIVPKLIEEMVLIPGQTFRLGKFEVTQAQWEAIMGTSPAQDIKLRRGDLPAFGVSWNDCHAFLNVLNSLSEIQQSGLSFRLPTETEWKLAGEADHHLTPPTIGKINGLQPVGKPGRENQPNTYGLYDYYGNVAEMTDTLYNEKPIAYGIHIRDSVSYPNDRLQYVILDKETRRMSVGFRLCADDLKAVEKTRIEEAAKLEAVGHAIISGMTHIPGKMYKMGKHEVTQAQWAAIMGENLSSFKGPDNPVECVSWDDCQSFLKKLNALPAVKAAGLVFRLPTNEEWEFACRAGTTGGYCQLADGTTITETTLDRVAWFADNSGRTTHPVGRKEPNAFGLYDMNGNVSEWTAIADGKSRGICGGCWLAPAFGCEFSRSNWGSSEDRLNFIGFRLCVDNPVVAETERIAREKTETERKAREETERRAREKAEAERKAQEEAERIAREKAEAERKIREEEERITREKEEAARKAAAEAARKAHEEALQRRRDEIASRTRTMELPGGVKLEMVKTPDGLWFGKTEVTRGQWDAVMNAASGGKSSRSGLQPPLLAKFAERGIDDAKIAGLMAQNEGFAEMIGQLKATFAQLESVGATSQMLDGDEFETLLDGLESLVGGSDGDEEDEDISSETSASDYPVVNVSIVDCAKFLKTLNGLPCAKAAGLRFRLPTLSEWKKASLGGGKRPFGTTFNGDTATIRDVGWIQDDNSGFRLHQVAQRQPNAWGLCDMFGNVREFVGPVPREDDVYIRAYGGSFRTPEENLMQDDAFNDPFWYKSKADDLGFRLCAEE